MKEKINTYFAVLLITIAGSGAAMLIIHVAYANSDAFVAGNEGQYASLQKSILK